MASLPEVLCKFRSNGLVQIVKRISALIDSAWAHYRSSRMTNCVVEYYSCVRACVDYIGKLARHFCSVNASDLLCYRMLFVEELWTVTEIEFPVHWLMVSDVQ